VHVAEATFAFIESLLDVLPPHQVDLTLPQSPRHDVHVPAHMSGSDLSRGGPEIAADAAKAKDK